MTSQLEIDQVRGLTAGGQYVNLMRSLPKAWANVNQTTGPASLRSSFNISSITDYGTGKFELAYTASFTAAADYGLTGAQGPGAGTTSNDFTINGKTSFTAMIWTSYFYASGNIGYYDYPHVDAMMIGSLAP